MSVVLSPYSVSSITVSEVKGKKFHTRQTKKQKIEVNSQEAVSRKPKQKWQLKQSMIHAIMQATIEAIKATILAVREANNPVNE